LTLHQPWAYCVVSKGKRIENRDWAPPDWMIGKYLAIHAGKTMDATALDALEHDPASPAIHTAMPEADAFVMGAVVAVAKLVSVVTESDDPWFRGPYGWVLSEVTAIEPVVCRGYQKLWPLDQPTLALVRARFAQALKAGGYKEAPKSAPVPGASQVAARARAVVERAKAALGVVDYPAAPAAASRPEPPKAPASPQVSAAPAVGDNRPARKRTRPARPGGAFPPDQRARYARGSSTSRRAAESIQETLNGLQAKVYAYIVGRGMDGATTDEIEIALDLSHQTASARVVELRDDLGYVHDPGPERRTRSGRHAMVHVAREFLPRNVQEKLYEAEQQKLFG
jgi:hypothetical protein